VSTDYIIIIPTCQSDAGRSVANQLLDIGVPSARIRVILNSPYKIISNVEELPCKFECEPVPGLVAGRHRALTIDEGSSDQVIIYLDDDISLPRNWLESILKPFCDPSIHFVGCRYLPDYEVSPPFWLEELWCEDNAGFKMLGHLSLLDGGATSRDYDPTYVWGLCFAVRKATLIELGDFHPDGYPWALRRYRGDGETGLALKAKAHGHRAFYQGETHVLHKVPTKRMTVEYFERRSFFQGVSDSYTRIRETGVIDGGKPLSPFKEIYTKFRQNIQRKRMLWNITTDKIKFLMNRAHHAGYEFHQGEARKDPALLEWILKPNYFDYQLPKEWRKYIN
jgi:glycosyltransferase involved in cell wall biosynthesis